MGSFSAAVSRRCILFLLLQVLWINSCASQETTVHGIDLGNPVIDVSPSPLSKYTPSTGKKDTILCERVRVAGLSRLKLESYASSFRVTLAPSAVIPEKFHGKIQVCFHRNASLGVCQCEKDDWRALQKGVWNSVMSPFEDRYVDVQFVGEVSGSVTVTVEEDFQRWRLLCLAMGFVLLILAPIFSSWVPFYYSSSMAVGIFLVIIILLFQGMKLMPTGRKNVFYLTIYGSVLGAGSFLVHHFSMMINSILVNFGMSEEMHNPVAIFVLVGIILAGAALGYWIVRKFVISEDGTVDVGIAQFVKWAMRIIAATSIFQSTLDTPLALGALASSWAICYLLTSKWCGARNQSYSSNGSLWMRHSRQATRKHNRAEFLSRSAKMSAQGKTYSSPRSSPAWSDSPVKGVIMPLTAKEASNQQEYYSTFHNTPNRRKFSKKKWDEFTQESTRQAMTELVSSPDFGDWIIDNASRIQLLPSDSSDEILGSESDSTEETVVESGNRLNMFKW